MKKMYVTLTYLATVIVDDDIDSGEFQKELYKTIGDDAKDLYTDNWEIVANLNDIEVEEDVS